MTHPLGIPTLTTDRLTLRAPEQDDFLGYAAFYESGRSAIIGGPISADEAWRHFAANIGHWHFKGFGWFTVDAGSAPVGSVGIHQGPRHPEPELGWLLYENGAGHGYATEAARAVLDWARGTVGMGRIVSHIDVANEASQAVAERLGASTDGSRSAHDAACEIWVHP